MDELLQPQLAPTAHESRDHEVADQLIAFVRESVGVLILWLDCDNAGGAIALEVVEAVHDAEGFNLRNPSFRDSPSQTHFRRAW